MQAEIIEKKVDTILRPTGISLAPYVFNPYQGCSLGCLFCYAQFSKVAQKQPRKWGQYVNVKINGLEILQKELKAISPQRVLIGSTTEPFQPAEKKYALTRDMIRLLNKRKTKYVLMSRSMLLSEYIGELDSQLCAGIYFTVDIMPEWVKKKLEPYAAASKDSIELVNTLAKNGFKVTAYFCPVMPFLHESLQNVKMLRAGVKAEFEIVNFQMAGMKNIISAIKQDAPQTARKYKTMCEDRSFYEQVVRDMKGDIQKIAGSCSDGIKIHTHVYEDYFKNIY